MPFNQQMPVPRVLTLRTTGDGIRLFMEPVEELKTLRGREHRWSDLDLGEAPVTLDGVEGQLFDIDVGLELGQAQTAGFEVARSRIPENSGRW